MMANLSFLFGSNVPLVPITGSTVIQNSPNPGSGAVHQSAGPGFLAILFLGVLIFLVMFGYKGRITSRLKQLPILLGVTLLTSVLYALITAFRPPSFQLQPPSIPSLVLGSAVELLALLLLGVYILSRYRPILNAKLSLKKVEEKEINAEQVDSYLRAGEYRQIVIYAYRSFCRILSSRGVLPLKHKTPREFAQDVLGKFAVLREETFAITALFETARYDKREITEDQAKLSLDLLERVKTSLPPMEGEKPNE